MDVRFRFFFMLSGQSRYETHENISNEAADAIAVELAQIADAGSQVIVYKNGKRFDIIGVNAVKK